MALEIDGIGEIEGKGSEKKMSQNGNYGWMLLRKSKRERGTSELARWYFETVSGLYGISLWSGLDREKS